MQGLWTKASLADLGQIQIALATRRRSWGGQSSSGTWMGKGGAETGTHRDSEVHAAAADVELGAGGRLAQPGSQLLLGVVGQLLGRAVEELNAEVQRHDLAAHGQQVRHGRLAAIWRERGTQQHVGVDG